MQLILDHLNAVLVASILIGVALTLNVRNQESAVEVTQFHAAKAQQSALIDLIEYDLEDLGSGVATGDQMITAYDVDGFGVKAFELRRELVDAEGEAQVVRVRYARTYAGSYTTKEDVIIPYFHIRRFVETENGAMASTTGSGYEVATFDLTLLGPDGNVVTDNLNAATSIRVHLTSALPFQHGNGDVKFTSWEGTFRPANLARRSDAVGGVGVGT